MAHSVGEQAARAVKNSQKTVVETRTPKEILKTIRGNIAAHLAVTPGDTKFLLGAFDAEKEFSHKLAEESMKLNSLNASQSTMIADLQAKIEEFRTVYEQENRNQTLRVDVLKSYGDGVQENLMQTATPEIPGMNYLDQFEEPNEKS